MRCRGITITVPSYLCSPLVNSLICSLNQNMFKEIEICDLACMSLKNEGMEDKEQEKWVTCISFFSPNSHLQKVLIQCWYLWLYDKVLHYILITLSLFTGINPKEICGIDCFWFVSYTWPLITIFCSLPLQRHTIS